MIRTVYMLCENIGDHDNPEEVLHTCILNEKLASAWLNKVTKDYPERSLYICTHSIELEPPTDKALDQT